ncbi:hypothetical protein [Saccharicrinis aurantiacus]|uniref:hypothetical protein n=1 Tax=Saccharicrinis aurantiacus TaxID=1849719 RepID=UPI0024912DDE|nr:hypothetical protein [Saccharicrinis aurantiacus]
MLSYLHAYGLQVLYRKKHNWKNAPDTYSPFDCNGCYDEFMQQMFNYADRILLEEQLCNIIQKLIYNLKDLHSNIGKSEWLFPYDKKMSDSFNNDLHFYLMLSAILCNCYHLFSGYIKANKYPSLQLCLPKLKIANKRMKLVFGQLPQSTWLHGLQTNILSNTYKEKYKLVLLEIQNNTNSEIFTKLFDYFPQSSTRYDDNYLENSIQDWLLSQKDKNTNIEAHHLSFLIKINLVNSSNIQSFLHAYLNEITTHLSKDFWEIELDHFQTKNHKKLSYYADVYTCYKLLIAKTKKVKHNGRMELEGRVKDIMLALYNFKEQFSPTINGKEDMNSLVHHMYKYICIKSQNRKKILEEGTILTYLKNLSSDY